MSQVYGLSGSATYSVELSGLDPILQVLPNNDVNQISARNLRDVVFTLWLNGGGGSEFFYTQGLPLTEKSTAKVGGVLANRNFENVSLQVLLDTMFFEPIANTRSIEGSGSFEYGFSNPTINITVTLTWRNTNNYTNATVGRGSADGNWIFDNTFLSNPNRPPSKGTSIETKYDNTPVAPNSKTTWTLVTYQPSAETGLSVYATWYFRRFYGWIDLSNFDSPTNGPFSFFNASQGQIDDIILGINDDYILNPTRQQDNPSLTYQIGGIDGKISGQPAPLKFTVPGLYHLWFAIPFNDYGGTGQPTDILDGNGLPLNFFKLLTQRSFENQYGYIYQYKIYVSNKKAGTGNYTFKGPAPVK